MSEEKDLLESAGFEVTDEVEIGDLDSIKEERNVIPAANNVKMRIRKVTNMAKNPNYRQLNISLAIVDGIEVAGQLKYKNSVIFHKVCYYADLVNGVNKKGEPYGEKDFFKNGQHLLELKALAKACDMKITKVNDDLFTELAGKEVVANIIQKEESFTAKDGTEVTTTRNYLKGLRAVPAGDMV